MLALDARTFNMGKREPFKKWMLVLSSHWRKAATTGGVWNSSELALNKATEKLSMAFGEHNGSSQHKENKQTSF